MEKLSTAHCPTLSKQVVCTHANTHLCTEHTHTHTHTHNVVLETQIRTQMAFFRRCPVLLEWSVVLPCHQNDWHACLFFPCPLEIQTSLPLLPRTGKACVCLACRTKKVGNRSTNHDLHQNKNKQTQEDEAAKEVQGSLFFATESPLMWLQAACQPNLIWIYIQRKCLV